MIDIAEARTLVGRRVRVTLPVDRSSRIGFLRGLPEDDLAVLQTPGNPLEVTKVRFFEIEWAPLTCEKCQGLRDKLSVSEPTWCVDCVRERAAEHRLEPARTACEDCGKPGAFRNPERDNTHLRCPECHAARGSLPVDYSVLVRAAGERAACATADIDSPAHTWKQMKSSRWRCTGNLCNAERYSPPPV